MPPPIVHINCLPGVDNWAIAKKLEAAIEAQQGWQSCYKIRLHLRIFDGGRLLIPSDPHDQQSLSESRGRALQDLINLPEDCKFTVIITDFQSDSDAGRQAVEQFVAAASYRGSQFIPVTLTCDAAVNAQKVRDDEEMVRRATKRRVLTPDDLAELSGKGEILKYEHLNLLELDVTGFEPAQVAKRIVEHVGSLGVSEEEETAQVYKATSYC